MVQGHFCFIIGVEVEEALVMSDRDLPHGLEHAGPLVSLAVLRVEVWWTVCE